MAERERLSMARLLKEQAVAPLLTDAAPAWLWHRDATHLLWANAAGGACFGASTLAKALALRFLPGDSRAAQVKRIAGTLYPGGVPRLERLRGFAPGIGTMLVCSCARFALTDGPAVLVAATSVVGRPLPLAARLRFLLAASDECLAAFTPQGVLLAATPAAARRLSQAQTLSAIGADSLAIAALAEGRAAADTRCGPTAMARIGQGDAAVLVATFYAAAEPAQASGADAETGGAPALATQSATPVLPSPPIADATLAPSSEPPPLRIDLPPPEGRSALRFVWQMDAEGRFTLGSNEFAEALGPACAAFLGRPWREIATALALDPDNAVLRAVETRNTWSGITVSFPVGAGDERVKVELSGLPIYDRARKFLGYRGFGVCRDVERLLPPQTAAGDGIISVAPPALSPDPAPAAALSEPAPNVVPFRPPQEAARAAEPPAKAMRLSLGEHDAFQEIARRLQAGLTDAAAVACEATVVTDAPPPAPAADGSQDGIEANVPRPDPPPPSADIALPPINALDGAPVDPRVAAPVTRDRAMPSAEAIGRAALTAFFDTWPIGLMICRFEEPLYANRAFLAAAGFDSLAALIEAGGLVALSVGPAGIANSEPAPQGHPLTLLPQTQGEAPLPGRLFAVPWLGEPAFALMLIPGDAAPAAQKPAERALQHAQAHIAELRGIVETAFDGVIVVGRDHRLVSANKSAEALFGAESAAITGRPFGELFAPESRGAALDMLDRIWHGSAPIATLANASQEVLGRTRQGQTLPLSMIVGVMPDGGDSAFVVFRDLTTVKRAETEFSDFRREAEKAQAGYADLMDKFSNSVRDTLQSISGFADMMLEERLGPLSRERYRGCLRDVRAASERIGELFDDIHRLRHAENGTLPLKFEPVDLNAMVQRCVKALQADASRDRIILRSALAAGLHPVNADVGSLQQVIETLLANAIKHANIGGQVIVSTAETERGTVVLRVREARTAAARRFESLVPQMLGKATRNSGLHPAMNADLDLVLTKALTEANHGTLNVSVRKNEGTMFELSLPSARIPAE